MDDPTDTALAVCAGLGLLFCCVGALVGGYRNGQIQARLRAGARGGMKSSPSMEHLSDAASDDTTDPVPSNNIV